MHVFPSKRWDAGSVRAGSALAIAPVVGLPVQAVALYGVPRRSGFRDAAELASGTMAAEGARLACEFKQEPRFVMWIVEAVAPS